MMTNLFSSFDPASNFSLPLNWLSTLSILFFMFPSYWKTHSKNNMLWLNIKTKLHTEFKLLLGETHKTTLIFITLLMLILMNNFLGLFPYIFTASSHLTMALSLSLPMWMSFMMFGWTKKTTHMLAHLVPTGTPNLLMPFMVLIETISNVIRPITLSVRLMANMMAGHLLMTLLGNQTASSSNLLLTTLIITQIMLLTLESAVAVIQSYVFTILATLYSSEVTPH